eukprot:symbB.v1.2.030057.t1/scaffold3347.1/size58713/4
MMQMDFRRVEGRFKPAACTIVACSLLGMLIVVLWTAHISEEIIEYSIGKDFGMFPSLALCNRAEHPVEFLKYSLEFSHSEYKKIEKKPKFSVRQEFDPELSRRCVYFISKEEDISIDIEFKVSMKESYNYSAPRQFSAVFSDMILNAHLPSEQDDYMGEYAGNMGILPTYQLGADKGEMTALRIGQSQTTTTDRKVYKNYFSKDARIYHLHFPPAPQQPIPPNDMCPKVDTEIPEKVVHWDMFVPRPQVVQEQTYVSQGKQFIKTLTSAGGAITILALLFSCIFPKKYPLSTSMAAVEMRTLRGYEERNPNPNVDPNRDRFLDWRFWNVDETDATNATQEVELPTVER